jgi:hypothetical protein
MLLERLSAALRARPHRRLPSKSRDLAHDSRAVRRERCSSAYRVRRSTAMTSHAEAVAAARLHSSSSIRSTFRAATGVPSVRAAMPLAANEFFARTRRASSTSQRSPARTATTTAFLLASILEAARSDPPSHEHRASRRRRARSPPG